MEPRVTVNFFHEIALKGDNRPMFSRQVAANIRHAIDGTGAHMLNARPMTAALTYPGNDKWPVLKERLEHLPGVERFARAYPVLAALDAMQAGIRELLTIAPKARSFRITASRSDKNFPLTSPDLNAKLGDFVKTETGLAVSLLAPDLNIRVHIEHGTAYLSLEDWPGIRGMPVGVSGHVVALLSGGIDSPVAAYQMMLRGCRVTFVHFHSFPLVEGTSREKAEDLVNVLTRYQFRSRLHMVSLADIQKRILLDAPPEYRVVLYRRFMLRIAEEIARREHALALITGESLGQVASQTLENMQAISLVMQRLPILRPLIAYEKEDIVRHARKLGTYDISIQPDQDCCSLFVPNHPVTRAVPEDVTKMEEPLDVSTMVQAAVDAADLRRFTWPPVPGRATALDH
ncbi:MAG: tRNA 4-thiouridine(8) synthase ThiI [Dehalococcoidia bacterium]|nr:tRNA 4-thiouridine(8) synthase ThiI [Dehalococcoidia bacterium]